MGKARYAIVTLLPLAWRAVVTHAPGWANKITAAPRHGFHAPPRGLAERVASGELPPGIRSAADAARMIFNDRLDAAVAGFFMVAVLVILADSAREWVQVVRGRKPARSTEVPFDASAVPVGD
jgi:carbon starvation protein